MRLIIWLFAVLLSAQTLFAQGAKQITLEDLWKKNTFKTKDVPGFNAMKDGNRYTQIDRDGKRLFIRVYNLASGRQERTLFDNSTQKFNDTELNVESYIFSNDESKMLLLTNGENIYRRSVLHHVYIYDIPSGKITLLDNEKVLHPSFSPDGKKVAYVKNNNLLYKNLQSNLVVHITFDGQKNKIINGNCDWVYEEEFSFTKAYEWSANGDYIAYYRFDESKVPEYSIAKYTGLYPDQYTYKYPKAGEPNSTVQIKFFHLSTGWITNANIGRQTDQYIPRIKWNEHTGQLCISRLNRLQNQLELLLTDPKDGQANVIYREQNKWYININDGITFLPGGHSMILSSEGGGYAHLFNWDWKSNKLIDLTPGSYDVSSLTGVDLKRNLVYYTSSEASPLEQKLYAVSLTGNIKMCLTPEKGTHAITPCAGFNYFLDRNSAINKVPVISLRNPNGVIIRTLEDNKAVENKMKEYAMGDIRITKIAGTHDMLNAWMITPPDFDSNKKYPVLMYQYSGPGSQEVADRFPVGNFFWHQMLAEKGYIIFCVDGTGTGSRGETFRKKTYLNLGKYESDDQIAAAQNIGHLPYVDKDRIGIWGWSYGGFMSSTCILKGNSVFKTAIAVAPVTNWRFYDNIYTERYMRTPQENPQGYDDNAPEKMAANLKGRFLLIHGTADDNVHFQNSVMFTTALINEGKQFESEYYPDKAHGISGGNTRYQLYTRMTNFILENL
jgi:dipeptidyl-peptidase-4